MLGYVDMFVQAGVDVTLKLVASIVVDIISTLICVNTTCRIIYLVFQCRLHQLPYIINTSWGTHRTCHWDGSQGEMMNDDDDDG